MVVGRYGPWRSLVGDISKTGTHACSPLSGSLLDDAFFFGHKNCQGFFPTTGFFQFFSMKMAKSEKIFFASCMVDFDDRQV